VPIGLWRGVGRVGVGLLPQILRRRLPVALVVQQCVCAKLPVGPSVLEGVSIAAEDAQEVGAVLALAMPRGRAPALPILLGPAPAAFVALLGGAAPAVWLQDVRPVRAAAVEVLAREQSAVMLAVARTFLAGLPVEGPGAADQSLALLRRDVLDGAERRAGVVLVRAAGFVAGRRAPGRDGVAALSACLDQGALLARGGRVNRQL